MDVRSTVLWVIIGCGAVTVVPRVLPLVLLSRVQLPGSVVRWLSYVPCAVLAALLAQSVVLVNGHASFSLHNLSLLAVVPAAVIAARTQNMFATVAGGVAAMALLRAVAG